MKKLIVTILFMFLCSMQSVSAATYRILVLPDSIFTEQKDYYILPDASSIIASDIINYLIINKNMSAPAISYMKNILAQNPALKAKTKTLLDKYKQTYMVDYNTVSLLATKFQAQYVLIIASNLDASNYFMRRTVWDALNIPGATVIDPAMRVSTSCTLINPRNQAIVWQNQYQKLISSRENRMIPTGFSPASEQVEKVKKYSTKFLAPQVVQEVQLVLFNVSEYTDFKKEHPEIVRPDAISIDRTKIEARRISVRSGRKIRKETKNFINTKKQNHRIRKEQFEAARIKRNELRLQQKHQKEALKLQKMQQQQNKKNNIDTSEELEFNESNVEIINRDAIQNVSIPNSNTFQPSSKQLPYSKLKPTLREGTYTINDI